MSCIAKDNERCTKCCEAIHVHKSIWPNMLRGNKTYTDQQSIRKYWIPISKRRAKKINPYIFYQARYNDNYIKNMSFFKCRALVEGVGCSIRDTDEHPQVCKIYKGGHEYSYTCPEDINIIARGG